MYTAPTDMLDSQPGTLMLTDCIDTCRANSSCRSINYETGLCVLFSSSADQAAGQLTPSQFPVFTIYVQKNCLPSASVCDAAWSFERVMDHQLDTQVDTPKILICNVQVRDIRLRTNTSCTVHWVFVSSLGGTSSSQILLYCDKVEWMYFFIPLSDVTNSVHKWRQFSISQTMYSDDHAHL